jgi:UDP-N-acetyl-D-glucosamine/UDP-N-acetyl-D-galactosamine dehydrogenase
MGPHIANRVIKLMAQNDLPINKADVLVLGITFKENCPDIRNSKVIDVIRELQSFGTNVDVFDPQADGEEVRHEYSLPLIASLNKKYHAIILAVNHDEFLHVNWDAISHEKTVIYDVKGSLDKSKITARL